MNYYSAMRKKITPFAATWVDLPEITLSTEDKYTISLKSGILKKKLTQRTYLQNILFENKLMVTKGENWGGGGETN